MPRPMTALMLERDKRIVELYESGLCTSGIMAETGCTQGVVSGALKRNNVDIRPQKQDLLGWRFDRLTVIASAPSKKKQTHWLCKCVCGKERVVSAWNLTSGHSKSCGCIRIGEIKAGSIRAGKSGVEYDMYLAARGRARKHNTPFNLGIEDIIIPPFCPILGIPLERRGVLTDNSPSLDKLIPELGYVKGNVRVISQRANRIKSDANVAELRAVADWLERELNA